MRRPYVPGPVPIDAPAPLYAFLFKELTQISEAMMGMHDWTVTNKEPQTLIEGMVRYASGAPGWDPGGGKGLYQYDGAVWVKL